MTPAFAANYVIPHGMSVLGHIVPLSTTSRAMRFEFAVSAILRIPLKPCSFLFAQWLKFVTAEELSAAANAIQSGAEIAQPEQLLKCHSTILDAIDSHVSNLQQDFPLVWDLLLKIRRLSDLLDVVGQQVIKTYLC